MSAKLTRLLTETLRSREPDIQPMPDLTARVLQKGRAARNRRLALGWGTSGLVAVVAVAAVVLGPAGRHLPNPGPANNGAPSPPATSSATATETAPEDPLLYAARLPSGPPRPTDPGRLLIATGAPGNGFCLHLYTLSSRQLGPVLTCSAGSELTVSPDGRRAVVGSTVVDLVTGRVGPKLTDRLASPFAQWEDPTHVLTHVLGNDAQGAVISIWVRCDVTSGACEQAPIPTSNGTPAVMDW